MWLAPITMVDLLYGSENKAYDRSSPFNINISKL
jgi:hypothetical protein